MNNGEFFQSNAKKYIVYLLEFKGNERMDKLNVYLAHYKNKDIARRWYREILKTIKSDSINEEIVERAVEELNTIYESLIAN